ncbi:DUF5320 domain-containing protein [Sporohalobacter salinus]|uniref:DUF5320 domain-containing protein n=1 Tax=Sporohalobacter salinus TaxID=1494606 RepID=UPI00196034FF|nr:DUF5320 domain-containing protein [Sporohalobacter salinus]MBM7622701.1 hypothetical protein [Sporohalobacter salinus]
MPWGDGTGPEGLGPMTGRGAGYCAGYNRPGYANSMSRRGLGRGFGRGCGRGMGRPSNNKRMMNRRVSTYRPAKDQTEAEINYLQQEKEALKNELKAIQERISELDSENNKE